jgi:hypothetical protein
MPLNAADIYKALQGQWNPGSHAWLANVRNSTGYTRRETYADAICVSCWPSRGIWIAGIEIKVHRSDWLRELKKPAKAEGIFNQVDYWWVAAPAGIVKVEELPKPWGLIECTGKGTKNIVQAPVLEHEPFDVSFLASVLRNQAGREKAAEVRGGNAAYQRYVDNHKSTLEEASNVDEIKRDLGYATRGRERAEEEVKRLRRMTGNTPAVEVERLLKIARGVDGLNGLANIRGRLLDIAQQLGEVEQMEGK